MKEAILLKLEEAFKGSSWELSGNQIRNNSAKGFKRYFFSLLFKNPGCVIQPGYCFGVKSITLAKQYIYPERHPARSGKSDFSFPLEVPSIAKGGYYNTSELDAFLDFF